MTAITDAAGMPSLCEQAMRRACEDFGAELREFNRGHDRARLPVFCPPKVSVPALVNSLKSVSARLLRSEYTGNVKGRG